MIEFDEEKVRQYIEQEDLYTWQRIVQVSAAYKYADVLMRMNPDNAEELRNYAAGRGLEYTTENMRELVTNAQNLIKSVMKREDS